MNEAILVVEDDVRLAKLLCQELSVAGYRADQALDGESALSALEHNHYALVILDLNLPDFDGVAIAERLQGVSDTRILMLTARGDVQSRVDGLYAGASDYMTKPFAIQELLARIHVRLRERQPIDEVMQVGALTLDPAAGVCRVDGQSLALSTRELALLELLLRNQGRIYNKAEIEDRLYGEQLPGSNTVEVFVSNIRRKLAEVGVDNLITTVRGRGYVVR